MYTKHFGLKRLPFENVPDPTFFFDEGDYALIRTRIANSLEAGRGLIVITGPIGSGKTTMSQMIKSGFLDNTKLIWMAEPPERSIDLFIFIAQELGLKPPKSERVFLVRDIKDALLKINSDGSKCLIIIDESHLMTDDILNGIRLLNNLEEGSTKLIQIFLLGQEEMMETINRPDMEPFKQRISTLEVLGKMNANRTRKYISHRIQVAGGNPSIFSETGLEAAAIAFDSGGRPRIINTLCDRSLSIAFEREKTIVGIHDVYEAAKEMGLEKEVFHYLFTLNNRENDSITKHTHSFSTKADCCHPTDKIPEIGFLESEIDKISLTLPILFLLLSMVALTLSIFFSVA